MQLSAQFKLKKETKGTFRYARGNDGAAAEDRHPIRPEVGAPHASPQSHHHHSRSIGLTLAALEYGHSRRDLCFASDKSPSV